MTITTKTLRSIIVFSAILTAIIIGIQLFWLQKIYLYEQKIFNINVTKSIRATYRSMPLSDDRAIDVHKLIENPQTDIYLAKTEHFPDIKKAVSILSEDFTDFDIFTDCKIGFYDHTQKRYTQQQFIDFPNAAFQARKDIEIPVFDRGYSYIALYFPNRNKYILKQMSFWIISGVVLIIALIGSALSIFFLYKQRFLNEIQKEFVNNFTHEFKTPLAVLKIAAGVLQQPSIIEKPEKLKNYAGILTEQIEHLQEQTQRLLQVAFSEQDTLPLRKENFDLSQIAHKAIQDLAPLIEEKKASVALENSGKEYLIFADKSYILLTFINIIENALKYSDNPIVSISIESIDKYYEVKIKDNGPGIEKIHQKKIFDKFYRITSGDLHQAKGFGLGLNFVKKVLDTHKATIKVESESGKGSLFIIKIPVE